MSHAAFITCTCSSTLKTPTLLTRWVGLTVVSTVKKKKDSCHAVIGIVTNNGVTDHAPWQNVHAPLSNFHSSPIIHAWGYRGL